MTDLKTCIKCGPKPTSDFHKDSSRSDGLYPVCKACRKPLTSASYIKNHDSIRGKLRAKYAANPERDKTYSKNRRIRLKEQDPEYMVAYNASYYLDHKDQWAVYAGNRDHEKVLASKRAYNETHREQIRAGVKDWYKRHPHASSNAARKRRAAWSKIEDNVTDEQLDEILEYFNHRCAYCLVDLRTLPKWMRTWDHIIAIKRGGPNTQDNVVPCCKSCNSRKKDRPIFRMVSYAYPPRQSIDASVGSRSEITCPRVMVRRYRNGCKDHLVGRLGP